MTYDELKNDPDIKWTEEPVLGIAMKIGNPKITDSYGFKIKENLEYYVGKHVNGYLIIFPVEKPNKTIEDVLKESGQLN